MKYKWLIGIDEAGRGPLAGPVSVGLVIVPAHFDWKLIPGVGDSKQLSETKREAIFERAEILQSTTRTRKPASVQERHNKQHAYIKLIL